MSTSFGWEGKGGYGSFHYRWMRGVPIKLWDPLRTHAIPERLRGVITTRRYTNPRLPYLCLHSALNVVTLSTYSARNNVFDADTCRKWRARIWSTLPSWASQVRLRSGLRNTSSQRLHRRCVWSHREHSTWLGQLSEC